MLSIEAPRLRSKCVGNGLICSSFVYNAGFVVIMRSLPSDSPSDSLGPPWGQTAGLSPIPFPSALATENLCQYKLDFELVYTCGCEGL